MALALTDSELLQKARERWKLGSDADSKQAKRERDDLAFYAGDQWPADIQLARQGQQPVNGMPAVPARPTLVINKVKEPVRQILNQERQSDIGIELVPADDFGDLGVTPNDDEIQLREGLIRRIQRESIAADARTWAFSRAVIAGRGYYLVTTEYLPGKTFDQEVTIKRIYNQSAVVMDPTHEQPDGSDADWEFVGTWVPWDRFASEHPKLANGDDNPFAQSTDSDFMGLTEDYPDWYQADGDERAVRVVDHWYTTRTVKELAILPDGSVWWSDEMPEDVEPVQRRTVVEKTVHYCKIGGGILELEQTELASPDMPIVKVLGEEMQPYDGQRRAEGMVRPSRDAQMGENALISKFIETVGLAPIPRDRVDPDSIEGYEAWWQVANTRTLPYLPVRTRDDEGREFRPPLPANGDPTILPMAQGIAMFDQFIKSTTAVPDPTLGNVDPSLKSGRAIKEVVANAALSTSNFLDNLARSMRYEGQIINNLLYPIYGSRPGRLVRIINGEGDQESRRMAMQSQHDDQTANQMPQGDRMAAPMGPAMGSPNGAMGPAPIGQAPTQPEYRLTKDANFNVIVKVRKSTESRRDQFVAMYSDILAADPNQMQVGGDLFYKNLDIPDAKALADRQRVMLAPPVQKLLADKEQGQAPLPPEVEAQMAQMSEQIKMAEGAMQQMQQALQTKQVENQAKVQIEQMKGQIDLQKLQLEAQRDLELARMDNATKIQVAEIAKSAKLLEAGHDALHEDQALGRQQAHEAAMADAQRDHDQAQVDQQMAHAAAMGDVGHEQQMAQGQQGQDFALEQQANQPEEVGE